MNHQKKRSLSSGNKIFLLFLIPFFVTLIFYYNKKEIPKIREHIKHTQKQDIVSTPTPFVKEITTIAPSVIESASDILEEKKILCFRRSFDQRIGKFDNSTYTPDWSAGLGYKIIYNKKNPSSNYGIEIRNTKGEEENTFIELSYIKNTINDSWRLETIDKSITLLPFQLDANNDATYSKPPILLSLDVIGFSDLKLLLEELKIKKKIEQKFTIDEKINLGGRISPLKENYTVMDCTRTINLIDDSTFEIVFNADGVVDMSFQVNNPRRGLINVTILGEIQNTYRIQSDISNFPIPTDANFRSTTVYNMSDSLNLMQFDNSIIIQNIEMIQ